MYWKSVVSGLVVFLAAFGIYMGNGRGLPSGDTVPGKLLPISMLTEKNLDLNEFEKGIYPGKRYCLRTVKKRKLSSYPLGAAFTALPVYTVAYLAVPHIFGSELHKAYESEYGDEEQTVASTMEDLSSAVIAALSALLIWLICRARLPVPSSALITFAYACGTPVMSTASQALWSHGASCLSLALMFYLLLRKESGRLLLALAGAAAGWAVFCRPTNALPILVLGLWVLMNCRWRTIWIGIGGLVVFAATSWLNYAVYGHILGGYAGHGTLAARFNWEALAGVLVSPSRGLFIFSPFLLASFVLGIASLLRRPSGYSGGALIAACAYILTYAFWPDWGGGFSFGPRLMCDAVPFLMIPLILEFDMIRRRRIITGLFTVLVALSCLVHVLGVYRGDGDWNGTIYAVQKPEKLWWVKDSQWKWTVLGR